jgi:anaerobic ribonucleoside-triphosphate reductase activating protein
MKNDSPKKASVKEAIKKQQELKNKRFKDERRFSYPLYVSFSDYPNPDTHSVVVYILGCDHACVGCHNPEFKVNERKEGVVLFTVLSLLTSIMDACKNNLTKNVVFSGGDPFALDNRDFVMSVIRALKLYGYNVCVYTGYELEDLNSMKLKGFIDYLKCGQYKKELKQNSELTKNYFRLASKNQKLYNINLELISNNGTHLFNEKTKEN